MTHDYEIHTITNHGLGERLAAVSREAGARGGTIMVGLGSASSTLLRMLAIGDVEKDVLVTLVTAAEKDAVYNAITGNSLVRSRKHAGISYCIKLGFIPGLACSRGTRCGSNCQ